MADKAEEKKDVPAGNASDDDDEETEEEIS